MGKRTEEGAEKKWKSESEKKENRKKKEEKKGTRLLRFLAP